MLVNCDMGESFGPWTMGQDALIMPYIDMANIACGMHASDPKVIQETVQLANAHNVQIGAHPGYADLQGFGRRHIAMSADELAALFIYQLGALQGICISEKTEIRYVKPHGALYNDMMRNDQIFNVLLKALAQYNPALPLMMMAVPDRLRYIEMAKNHNIKLIFEAFIDRSYQSDGRLTPRSAAHSVHTTLTDILAQADSLIEKRQVVSVCGKTVMVDADTLCIHGDGKLALEVAKKLRQRLQK
jgi:5-oxoprolinase (ATP-hydrolysing) subunit A